MNQTHDVGAREVFPAALFTVIAVLVAFDLAEDAVAGAGGLHLAIELGIMIAAGVGAALLWLRMQQAWREAHRLGTDLEVARLEGERWRAEAQEHIQGLGAAIDVQFERWGLTAAEREVGLLLLKGLSLKEAAVVRGTSERTVRQQAFTLYGKAGLAGRAELSAFFLEDLLLPVDPGERGD